jgi:glutaminase
MVARPAEDAPVDAGPTGGPVDAALEQVIERIRAGDTAGIVASYIPELAGADPEHFGVSAISALGHVYRAGDADVEFTIQSISKPFVYALALEEIGIEAVRARVGVEPSGEPFNAISFDAAGRPVNPMINLGAITTTSLIPADSADERFGRIRSALSAFAGRALQLDEAAYLSEASTGDRNVALAGLAKANGALIGEVEDAVDPYFRQCSLKVTAADLAAMGATLASGGINPLTGEQVISAETARRTLSVMASCGMYDLSGQWILDVGMPAKSGVGGGIVAVTPGSFGIGVFSPPLDDAGNSARGTAVLKELVAEFGLHLFDRPVTPVSPIETIREHDGNVVVYLRGELDFLAAERIAFEIAESVSWETESLVLDLGSVTRVEPVAARLLRVLGARARAHGRDLTIVDERRLLGD